MNGAAPQLRYTVHSDGTFDIDAGCLNLVGCYPAIDGVAVHPTGITVERDQITYRLIEGEIILQLSLRDGELIVGTVVRGMKRAPDWLQPLAGTVEGASRFFRQGLGFAGPSGFVAIEAGADVWSLESYLVSGLEGRGGGTLAIAATDHHRYQQKTTLALRQSRRGLINRHVQQASVYLSAGFATEAVPIDGELKLPDLHLFVRPNAPEALRHAAIQVGTCMKARVHQPPRYHWCSWYDRGPYFSLAELKTFLGGLSEVKPRMPLQAIQIDDGYCTHGDWRTANHLWPGGLPVAFDAIRSAGYEPGVWIGPFMVGRRSDLFRDHPDWMIRDAEGRPHREWRAYNHQRRDEEHYALDATHPEVVDYLRQVFRTMREWGASFFKTDFMDWGLKDGPQFRRHDPARTSVEAFRSVMSAIREEIGEQSYWLACIAPYAPMLGFADGMRVANDVSTTWNDGGVGNMLSESETGQYFNNVWWQNDPDALYLRDYHIELSETQIQALAFWQGILGVSVNTSDSFHRLSPERLKLWRFLQPEAQRWAARMPYWGSSRKLKVAVRDYPSLGGSAVLAMNPANDPRTEQFMMRDLVDVDDADVYAWGPDGAVPLGRRRELVAETDARGARLFYVSERGGPPPSDLTLGGFRQSSPSTGRAEGSR